MLSFTFPWIDPTASSRVNATTNNVLFLSIKERPSGTVVPIQILNSLLSNICLVLCLSFKWPARSGDGPFQPHLQRCKERAWINAGEREVTNSLVEAGSHEKRATIFVASDNIWSAHEFAANGSIRAWVADFGGEFFQIKITSVSKVALARGTWLKPRFADVAHAVPCKWSATLNPVWFSDYR